MTNEKKKELLDSALNKLTNEELVVLSQYIVAKYNDTEKGTLTKPIMQPLTLSEEKKRDIELRNNISRAASSCGVSVQDINSTFSKVSQLINNVEA